MRRALAALLLLSALRSPLAAQPAPGRAPVAASTLQVWLITFGEGELYWEKFGHNALWFRDSTQGIDEAYNWGMFDFVSPGFLERQIIGDPQYWVDAVSGTALIEAYRQRDRTVVVQRLNLTPEQARRAHTLSRTNALEANKFYRYDYFRDNCSTRVRDMIDAVLDGALKAATTARVPRSYRSETLRLVDDLKVIQLGIDVALGRPADRPLTVWESAFAPSRLRDALRDVRVKPDSASPPVALVAEERTLYESRTHVERETTPRLWLAYLAIGVVLAVLLAVLASKGMTSAGADTAFRLAGGVWSLLCGALGAIVLLGWLITQHVFWYNNVNLLLLNPLSLFLAGLAFLSMRKARFTRAAAIVAAIVAIAASLAIIALAIPALRQDNLPLILLLVPSHFVITWGLVARARVNPEGAPTA